MYNYCQQEEPQFTKEASKLATISDVARLSGLSVSTVSRVINNKPHVSEEKRRRVQETMDALGYSPLQAARQMRGSGSQNIAVVVPTITNNFFAELVDSIERACRDRGYRTLMIQTGGQEAAEEDALNLLKLQHADGVILCSIENRWDVITDYLQYGKIVVCDEYNDQDDISMIHCRQCRGFRMATQYLLRKGHRRVAYCTGAGALVLQPEGLQLDSDRYRGYVEALSQNGMLFDPSYMMSRVNTFRDGREAMRKLLALEQRPDAIISGSDEAAAGMEMEALENGIRIPEDIAIMGVDDQIIATCLPVPLTTIKQPIQEMGRLAALEMVRQLEEEDAEPIRKELDLELVIRRSA